MEGVLFCETEYRISSEYLSLIFCNVTYQITLVNTHFVALTRPVVLDYIWSAENGGDIGFAQCHLVWTGLPDLGLPGPKSSFSNFSGKLAKNFTFLTQHSL